MIKHTTPYTKPNNPAYEISRDAWNEDHTIDDGTISIAKLTDPRHVNRLKDILAVAANFDTAPTSLVRLTDGDFTLWTGEGIKSLAGVNGEVGRLTFDMGASYPITIVAWMNIHRASGDGTITLVIETSDDNITYAVGVSGSLSGVAGDLLRNMYPAFGYGRYVRLRFTTASVTVNPSVFHVKLAEVQALDFL
jgi:hypothetical protein